MALSYCGRDKLRLALILLYLRPIFGKQSLNTLSKQLNLLLFQTDAESFS